MATCAIAHSHPVMCGLLKNKSKPLKISRYVYLTQLTSIQRCQLIHLKTFQIFDYIIFMIHCTAKYVPPGVVIKLDMPTQPRYIYPITISTIDTYQETIDPPATLAEHLSKVHQKPH